MIELLKQWINSIVVVIIFAAFIDILIPGSSMKKYVKLVLGLIIMTVILQPVIKLVKGDFSISTSSFQVQNRLDNIQLKKQTEYYDRKQADAITKAYKQNLENQIKQQIKGELKEGNADVSVDIVEDTQSSDYGQLKKITITLKDKIDKVEKVDKITIGKNRENESSNKVKDNDYQDIKSMLSLVYGIDKQFIEINTLN